jgi:hypothetical protein
MLDQEIAYYQAHLDQWLKDYPGKYVSIKGEEVVGFFNSRDEALTETVNRYGIGSYLIRQIGEGSISYINTAFELGILHADLPLSS